MRSRMMMAVAAAVVLTVGTAAWAQMGGPASVYLEPAEVRAIRQAVELIGVAEARRTSTIGAEAAGRVEKMLVEEGDFVKAGAPLCQLRRLPVELQLRKAEGQLAAAKATLTKAEQGFRREEIDQAEARLKAAQAGFERWQQEYERTKRLLADGASTQAEMDANAAAFRQARELKAEAEASLALVKAGNRVEDIDGARAQMATQTAAVEELRDILAKMTITMPFDGFVVGKRTDEGAWLNPGVPVVDVVDIGVIRIRLDVPERHLAGLAVGAKAPAVFDALGDREFAGTVSQIVPRASEGTHTIPVRIDVANPVEKGRPVIAAGVLGRVWLPVGAEHQALLVPKAAVIRQDGRDVVYTVADTRPADSKVPLPPPPKDAEAKDAKPSPPVGPAVSPVQFAIAIPVRIVGGHGRFMEVEAQALKAGTLVVTRGTYLLAHGSPVQVYPKEMPPVEKPTNAGGEKPGGPVVTPAEPKAPAAKAGAAR